MSIDRADQMTDEVWDYIFHKDANDLPNTTINVEALRYKEFLSK